MREKFDPCGPVILSEKKDADEDLYGNGDHESGLISSYDNAGHNTENGSKPSDFASDDNVSDGSYTENNTYEENLRVTEKNSDAPGSNNTEIKKQRFEAFISEYTKKTPFDGAGMITMSEEENVYYEGMPVYVKDIEKEGKTLSGAYLCITALGQYEAYINGKKVGDAYFTPGWTDFNDRLLYRIYDVTDMLSEKDTIAVCVGTGWWAGRNAFGTYDYKRPALIAQLNLLYEDGTRQVISTDESWKYVKDTAIRDADYFNGETFDTAKPDVSKLSLGIDSGEKAVNDKQTDRAAKKTNGDDGSGVVFKNAEIKPLQ